MAKWQKQLNSQTNHLQLNLEYKKLRFKYNNAMKDVDHCIFQGFTYKKQESNFQKNDLLHWYLKLLWNKKKFLCMWILAYYLDKWSEEFKLDYCPYDVVYTYLPGCFSLRNFKSWWMIYLFFLCISKMFQGFLRINSFHWVTNLWVSEDHYKLTNSWNVSVEYCTWNLLPMTSQGWGTLDLSFLY